MNSENVRVWFTAISAVVAALAFVVGLIRYQKEVRSRKIFDWQRVIVHEILQKSDMEILSFGEIRSRYLTEVHAYQGEKIPQKELSAPSLRRILLSMIADELVRQFDRDRYSLNCDDFISVQARLQANEKSRRLHEIYHAAYSEILSNPFKMNIDQMISKVSDLKGYKGSEIRVEIEHMLNTTRIYRNAAGLIGPKHLADDLGWGTN